MGSSLGHPTLSHGVVHPILEMPGRLPHVVLADCRWPSLPGSSWVQRECGCSSYLCMCPTSCHSRHHTVLSVLLSVIASISSLLPCCPVVCCQPSSQKDLFQYNSDCVILPFEVLTPFLAPSKSPNPNDGPEDSILVVLMGTGNDQRLGQLETHRKQCLRCTRNQ